MRRLLIFLCFIPFSVFGAEDIKILGTFGDWTAYSFQDGTQKVCYMSAQPKKSVGKYKKRGDIFLMVTHRPQNKTYDVVSFVAGYTYKKNAPISLQVDKNAAISLTAHEDTAWAKTDKLDKKIVAQLKSGSLLTIRGTSSRGTKTTDTFSLTGTTKAYDKIKKACP